jgi:hypothetical protein
MHVHRITHISLCCALLFTLLSPCADAAGKRSDLPEQYRLGSRTLTLNGTGIRSKFFIKIYVGALYLGRTTSDARQVLDNTGPMSMQMVMLYDEVAAQKIAAAWQDGFEANLSGSALQKLSARLERFNALFPDLHKGDWIKMDFVPGSGTTLIINDKVLGQIPGYDFFAALLRVWIGEHPADKALKNGLLGK